MIPFRTVECEYFRVFADSLAKPTKKQYTHRKQDFEAAFRNENRRCSFICTTHDYKRDLRQNAEFSVAAIIVSILRRLP